MGYSILILSTCIKIHQKEEGYDFCIGCEIYEGAYIVEQNIV